MWRIMQIEENVIHLGLQPWMAANAFFWFTLHALGGRAWKRPWLMVYCPPMQRVPHPRGGGTRVWWSPTNLLSGRIMNPQQNLKPLSSSDSPASFAHLSLSLQKGEWLWGQKHLFLYCAWADHCPQSYLLKVICDATIMSYLQMT